MWTQHDTLSTWRSGASRRSDFGVLLPFLGKPCSPDVTSLNLSKQDEKGPRRGRLSTEIISNRTRSLTATRPHARLVLALSRGQRTMHFFHLVPPESLRDKYLALGANFLVVFAISVAVVAGWINLLGTILPLGSAPTTIAELVMQLNLALAAFGIAVVTCRSAYDSVRFGRRRVVVNAQSQTHKQMVWYVYIILFVRGRTLDTRDPPTPRAAASRPPLLISDKRCALISSRHRRSRCWRWSPA